MKVRLATKAVGNGTQPVESMDDVRAGIKMPWVELDGHRFEDLAEARIEMASNGALRTYVTFQFIGPVEIVYVDRDGNEISSIPVDGGVLPEVIDRHTYMEVPDEIHPALIEASKQVDKIYRDGSGNVKQGWPE